VADDGSPATSNDNDLNVFSLFEGVSLTARANLLFDCDERTLQPGEVLIEHGADNSALYLVMNGRFGVYLDKVHDDPLAFIERGETVGELSIIAGSEASGEVVAEVVSTVLVIGEDAFWALTNESHPFAVKMLVTLAERLRANNATVSRNVRKRRMFERAAMFDGLTGIHNRRWLDESLHRMVERHRHGGGALCVALLDIDHFKGFNDRYGHEAGDYVLTEVAGTLTENLRPTDLAARFGGEEFVIIFPDTKQVDALMVAERVREAVQARPLVAPGNRELPNVTISIGVAELEAEQTVPSLMKVADSAMYRAKHGGRNQVMPGSLSDLETTD